MQDTYDYIVVIRNDRHILATNYTYSHDKKGTYPYYISPIEIGLI